MLQDQYSMVIVSYKSEYTTVIVSLNSECTMEEIDTTAQVMTDIIERAAEGYEIYTRIQQALHLDVWSLQA